MKKIFGKIDHRRDDKENEKAHSSFIGKKFVVGKHPVVVEVRIPGFDHLFTSYFSGCNSRRGVCNCISGKE